MQQQVKSKGYIKLFFELIFSAFKSIFSKKTYYNDKENDEFIENITDRESREFELTKLKNQREPLLFSLGVSGLAIICYYFIGHTNETLGIFVLLFVSQLWTLNNIKHKILLLKLAEKLDIKTEPKNPADTAR